MKPKSTNAWLKKVRGRREARIAKEKRVREVEEEQRARHLENLRRQLGMEERPQRKPSLTTAMAAVILAGGMR